MSDERLVGYRSDDVLYQGAMEAADIAFAFDRSGWIHWSRIGGVFFVHRFGWHTSESGLLQLRLRRYLSGTWTVRGGHVEHRVDRQSRSDAALSFAYTISAERDVVGDPITLLELDRPVSVGVVGERFAFEYGQGLCCVKRSARSTTARFPVEINSVGV